ncbi:MAG: hypothetical protein GXP62_20220, partial [Oligoflexia bacterium]|nr:hypothetical protein [Oligoflexia bacterium]
AFANDLYSREQGERLFPLIALGATVGAVVGAKVAGLLFESGMDAYSLLHVAAAILALTVVTYQVVASGWCSRAPTYGSSLWC